MLMASPNSASDSPILSKVRHRQPGFNLRLHPPTAARLHDRKVGQNAA